MIQFIKHDFGYEISKQELKASNIDLEAQVKDRFRTLNNKVSEDITNYFLNRTEYTNNIQFYSSVIHIKYEDLLILLKLVEQNGYKNILINTNHNGNGIYSIDEDLLFKKK